MGGGYLSCPRGCVGASRPQGALFPVSPETTDALSPRSSSADQEWGGHGGTARHFSRWTTMRLLVLAVKVEVLSTGNGVEQGGLTVHHEWQVPQGGPGRLPGPAEGGDAEGPERAGWGWHDTDVMGCVPRQPGGSAAHRGEGVGIYNTKETAVNSTHMSASLFPHCSSFFQIFPVSDEANDKHIVKWIIIFSKHGQLDDVSFAAEPHIYI